jgi:hypothetical protein
MLNAHWKLWGATNFDESLAIALLFRVIGEP